MLRSLYNIPISRRVFLSFALTTTFALMAISLLSVFYFEALMSRDQAVKTAFAAQHVANDQLVNLQRMNALLRTRLAQVFATTGGSLRDPSLEASGGLIAVDILTRKVDFAQTLVSYQQNYELTTSGTMSDVRSIVLSDDPTSTIGKNQQAALTTVATSEWPRYQRLQDRILLLLDPATNPTLVTNPTAAYEQAYSLLFQGNEIFLTLTNDWQQVVDSAQTIGEIVTNVGPSQYQPILISTSLALFFTLLVIILAGITVNLTITRPLRQLVVLTRRIARGENQARAQLRGRDEIAQVAGSMNGMLDYIVKLIEASESQRAQLNFQVEQLIHDVSGVGQGDLRAHADETSQDLGELARSFNFMISALSSLIIRIKQVAYEVASSTPQVSTSINHLVTSAEQQVTEIREASLEVERMASQSNRVAQRASQMSAVAVQAQKAASEGAGTVQKTVQSIQSINANMRETVEKVQTVYGYSSAITTISETMAALAQKTNRLALDASIHANVAGATNHVFATVASEMRKLAQQAGEESDRIGGIARTVIEEITALQRVAVAMARETESIASFATQTGQALETSFLAVQRQAGELQEMAKVATAQGQSSQKVVAVMQRVSQATLSSSRVTQDVLRQVNKQSQLILQLYTSVEAFKVGHEQPHVSTSLGYVLGSSQQ